MTEQQKLYHGWEECALDAVDLAKLIAPQINKAAQYMPVLIALGRGGLPVGTMISNYLQLEYGINHVFVPYMYSSAKGAGRGLKLGNRNAPELNEVLPKAMGRREVIIFDDIVDSGYTMRDIKANIARRGAKKIITCAQFIRPERTVDFSCWTSEKDWIVFPWENFNGK